MNAGCGFACTVHANSARDALAALTNAAIMAGENVTEPVVRRVFASALDVVVHLERDATEQAGSGIRRRVTEVHAVTRNASSDYTTESLFERRDLGSPLKWTGSLPPESLTDRLNAVLPAETEVQHLLSGDWLPDL